MSVRRTDALAAWRSERIWCTREDLNLHAARAAASEAAASAVSPRVPIWCWLEDSNLPPLAYEASALPDELSQLLENRQKDRGAAPGVEATLSGAPRLGAASKSGRSRCQRARRHRRRSHRRMGSCAEDAHACARAVGTGGEFGSTSVSSAGHLPSCLSGGGGTLRRLFRFPPRALLGAILRAGDAPIAARADGQPTVRSIRPSGGGAERGGDM